MDFEVGIEFIPEVFGFFGVAGVWTFWRWVQSALALVEEQGVFVRSTESRREEGGREKETGCGACLKSIPCYTTVPVWMDFEEPKGVVMLEGVVGHRIELHHLLDERLGFLPPF